MVIVLVVVSAISLDMVRIGNENKRALDTATSSLTILRCAVSKEVRSTSDGKPTTRDQAVTAFDACVKHGGPTGP